MVFIPIIAHVERYKATRNDIGFLTELKDMGAHIQVNADTISGQDGFGAKTFRTESHEAWASGFCRF